jgi:hypothetical protein
MKSSRPISHCEYGVSTRVFRRLSLQEIEVEAVTVTLATDSDVTGPILREDVIAYNSYYLTTLPVSKSLVLILKGLGGKMN